MNRLQLTIMMFNDFLLFQAHHTKVDLDDFNKACAEHRFKASDIVDGSSRHSGFVKPVQTSIDDHFNGGKKSRLVTQAQLDNLALVCII